MQKHNLAATQCPIARSMARVGEWWSILILRDALHGLTRFDEFQRSLEIAPNMLARRLNSLVESGLMRRRPYSVRPPRDEYVLTELGQDFRPVVLALQAWGNRHFALEGRSVLLVNRETGLEADPLIIDRVSGLPLTDPVFTTAPGPAANERTRLRHGSAHRRPWQAAPAAGRPSPSKPRS